MSLDVILKLHFICQFKMYNSLRLFWYLRIFYGDEGQGSVHADFIGCRHNSFNEHGHHHTIHLNLSCTTSLFFWGTLLSLWWQIINQSIVSRHTHTCTWRQVWWDRDYDMIVMLFRGMCVGTLGCLADLQKLKKSYKLHLERTNMAAGRGSVCWDF